MNKKNYDTSESILLVGAGNMAMEYGRVLKAMKSNFIVVGRGKASARNFSQEIKKPVVIGGIKDWIKRDPQAPIRAIVAVSEKELGKATLGLLRLGVKSILVEKPGGFDEKEIVEIKEKAREKKAKVFVGYNRRFYASVEKARKIIKEDGGVSSFFFDFTELNWIVSRLKKEKGVKEKWFLHNSTHVVDLAFFLAGKPRKFVSYVSGKTHWHPKGAVFVGVGTTKKNALFSYKADWQAPGRWGIEIMTRKHKLILRPLEKLEVQLSDGFGIKEMSIDNKFDLKYKPGIYRQVEVFLGNNPEKLCTIGEQVENLAYYNKILKNNN